VFATAEDATDVADIQIFLDKSVKDGCEGFDGQTTRGRRFRLRTVSTKSRLVERESLPLSFSSDKTLTNNLVNAIVEERLFGWSGRFV
jgi:hypothetical protein